MGGSGFTNAILSTRLSGYYNETDTAVWSLQFFQRGTDTSEMGCVAMDSMLDFCQANEHSFHRISSGSDKANYDTHSSCANIYITVT